MKVDMRSEVFTCNVCKQVVPWSKGCDDDMPDACDDCWAAAHVAIDTGRTLKASDEHGVAS